MVVRLVPDLPKLRPDSPRLWLVFFGDGEGPAWWARWFRPGFRHVTAAAYHADRQRWVYYNPARRGTALGIFEPEEFGPMYAQLLATSTAVLRVRSRFERRSTPAVFHCVGAIKALLGVRSCALGPWGLYRHLLASGAEIVEVPGVEPDRRPDEQSGVARPGEADLGKAAVA